MNKTETDAASTAILQQQPSSIFLRNKNSMNVTQGSSQCEFMSTNQNKNRSKQRQRRVTIIRKVKHRDGSVDVEKRKFHDLSVQRAVQEMKKGSGIKGSDYNGESIDFNNGASSSKEVVFRNYRNL